MENVNVQRFGSSVGNVGDDCYDRNNDGNDREGGDGGNANSGGGNDDGCRGGYDEDGDFFTDVCFTNRFRGSMIGRIFFSNVASAFIFSNFKIKYFFRIASLVLAICSFISMFRSFVACLCFSTVMVVFSLAGSFDISQFVLSNILCLVSFVNGFAMK